MKKNLILVFLFFSSISIFAQNQSINLLKLKVESPKTNVSQGSGIELFCTVKYSIPIKNFSERFYNIYPRLSDKSGNIILDSKDVKGYSQADPYYKGKDDFSIFIPYTLLPFEKGQHSCILELYSSHNDSIMPVFYKGDIFFDVPEMYNYEDQKITIENFNVITKEKSGVEGLEILFDANFSFPSSKIKGASEKPNLKNYYFYITVNEASRPFVFSPNKSPENSDYYSWNPFFATEAVDPVKKLQCKLFVPLTQLQILEGNFTLDIQLNAINFDGTIKWEHLAKTKIQITIPKFGITKIAVKNITVAEGEYDIAGKNIPIVNIFTGGKKNRGLGYPDVMWKVNQGFFTAYATKFLRNSHFGPNDTCYLKTIGNEKLDIVVLDYDAVGRDDELARFSINPKIEDYKIEHTGLRKSNVLNIDLSVSKTSLPNIGKISIIGETKKIDGTTGLFVEIQGIKETLDSIFSLWAVILNHDEETFREKINSNSEGKVFFIPWFLNEKTSKAGLEIIHTESGKTLDFICTPYIEKPKRIYDLAIEVENKESLVNGFKGVEITLKTNAPNDYIKYSNKLNFNFHITEESGRTCNYLSLEKSVFSTRIFIPFYKLNVGEEKLKTCYSISGADRINLADTNIIVPVLIPELLVIKPDSIFCKNKKFYKKFQTIYWEISHGKDDSIQLSENKSHKSMGWKIPDEYFIKAHPEDNIYLKIKGLSYFGKEILLETHIFSAEEFSKNKKGKKKLPSSSYLKSCYLYYRN
ncbi:MAG: hypothetical protein JXR58_06805 [Bacteroidales bacterium]|nr:hypothetical protein [Bacteroidales bacterium]